MDDVTYYTLNTEEVTIEINHGGVVFSLHFPHTHTWFMSTLSK